MALGVVVAQERKSRLNVAVCAVATFGLVQDRPESTRCLYEKTRWAVLPSQTILSRSPACLSCSTAAKIGRGHTGEQDLSED
jgi:hypothetical protein